MKKHITFFVKNCLTVKLFIFALLFALSKPCNAQENFVRGIFMFGVVNNDYEQLRDSLHLSWAQAKIDEMDGTKLFNVLRNTGNLDIIGISLWNNENSIYHLSSAQRMVYEAELDGSDPLKNYFAETPSGEPDLEDPSLLKSVGSEGYMVKSPVPDNEYNYKRTHYTASFVLKRAPAPSGNPEVVLLEAVCKNDGSILSQRVFYNNDFSTNELETKILEFDLTYDPNFSPKAFGVLLGEPESPSLTCTGVDIRVYWPGNVTVWLDKVIIEDDLAKGLFAGQHDAAIQSVALNYKNNFPLMKRFYLADEPYLSAFSAYKYVDDLISEEIPGITALFDDEMERFLIDAQPLELLVDRYVISADIPSPAITDGHADSLGIARYQGALHYNTTLQNQIDNLFITTLKKALLLTKPLQKKFYFVPQLHGEYFERNGMFQKPSGQIRMRPPTGNEVSLQCNLALTYGTKGLIPFPLGTERVFWDDVEGYADFAGLLTTHTDINGIHRNHWTNYGLFPWKTGEDPNRTMLIRMGYKEKWDALANFNAKLINIGPTLMDLTCDNTYSIHHGQPTGKYITSVTTTDAADKRYIELGLFNKEGEVSSEYFFIVNRRTLQQESRDIEVHYDKTNTNPYNFYNWTVRELGTNNYWSSASPANEFTTNYNPGDGKLFSLEPTVIGGGSLIYNEVISSDIVLKRDLIIESGVTLTVNADYNCYGNITLNGGTIKGNGKIVFHNNKRMNIAQGTNQIYGSSGLIEIDFTAPHHMNGIQVMQNTNFRVWNSIIRNARVGITAGSNVSYFRASNVYFFNCVDGGININGPHSSTPNISLCQFNNLSRGVMATNLSEILIQYNQFINSDNGITLINVTNPYMNNNSITSNKKTLPAIFLESCNGVIRNNTISGHTNGIHLGNSSPAIGVNQITNNLYHGIYVGIESMPQMNAKLFYDPPLYYPISGYNQIWENGGTTTGGPPDNDGSEIFFNNSNADMQKGCNSIYDDRSGGEHPPYNTRLLMNGIGFQGPIHIQAEANFWSNNPQYPLEERFGNLLVDFDPYLLEPCEVPGGGGNGEELFVKSSTGEIIDTLYPVQRIVENLTSTDLLYAVAEEKFISAVYTGAEEIFNQIVNGSDSLELKLPAYRRLYDIGKLSSKPESYFNNLNNVYTSLVQSTK